MQAARDEEDEEDDRIALDKSPLWKMKDVVCNEPGRTKEAEFQILVPKLTGGE